MANKQNKDEIQWVPRVGEVVTYVTPQGKKIYGCKVIRMFDNSGRVRVKNPWGECYSGTLEQLEQMV